MRKSQSCKKASWQSVPGRSSKWHNSDAFCAWGSWQQSAQRSWNALVEGEGQEMKLVGPRSYRYLGAVGRLSILLLKIWLSSANTNTVCRLNGFKCFCVLLPLYLKLTVPPGGCPCWTDEEARLYRHLVTGLGCVASEWQSQVSGPTCPDSPLVLLYSAASWLSPVPWFWFFEHQRQWKGWLRGRL